MSRGLTMIAFTFGFERLEYHGGHGGGRRSAHGVGVRKGARGRGRACGEGLPEGPHDLLPVPGGAIRSSAVAARWKRAGLAEAAAGSRPWSRRSSAPPD